MSEERRMILQMLKEGSVSVEEAERLLDAVPAKAGALAEGDRLTPKRIFVLVTEHGKPKVNVKVPFSLVRVGLKLGHTFGIMGAKFTDSEQEAKVMETLQHIDIDEVLDSLNDGEIALPYTLVDVEDTEKDQQVRVVLE